MCVGAGVQKKFLKAESFNFQKLYKVYFSLKGTMLLLCAGLFLVCWKTGFPQMLHMISVTRFLGNLLDFGQLFKAFGNN